ncbi:MAG: hypothetical protein A3E79_08690 [Burkholderiales bacterium RIFCSPHIGHO2_12_FULL_61_11]|nr:MAG: hypothetical protein A3E79_08690 [Burkholderiales bacterium RIFCSPHIGHO2_12_FULL_61_11]
MALRPLLAKNCRPNDKRASQVKEKACVRLFEFEADAAIIDLADRVQGFETILGVRKTPLDESLKGKHHVIRDNGTPIGKLCAIAQRELIGGLTRISRPLASKNGNDLAISICSDKPLVNKLPDIPCTNLRGLCRVEGLWHDILSDDQAGGFVTLALRDAD